MKYKITDGELFYKDEAGEWKACTCPFLADATCGLACPHF
jgi:hypothetical protein